MSAKRFKKVITNIHPWQYKLRLILGYDCDSSLLRNQFLVINQKTFYNFLAYSTNYATLPLVGGVLIPTTHPSHQLWFYLIGFLRSKIIVIPLLSSCCREQISSIFIGIKDTLLLQFGQVLTIPLWLIHCNDQLQLSHTSRITSGNVSPLILNWIAFISSLGTILLSGDSTIV